jgi:hypothetical protein
VPQRLSLNAVPSPPQVIQEFRRRLDACDEEMIACSRAGDVEQVALGVIHFLQIGDRLGARLPLEALLYTGVAENEEHRNPLSIRGWMFCTDTTLDMRSLEGGIQLKGIGT